jgi:hypothetical protein
MVLSSGLGFRAPAETPQVLAFMVFDLEMRPARAGRGHHPVPNTRRGEAAHEGGRRHRRAREMVNQRDEVVQGPEYKLLVARGHGT